MSSAESPQYGDVVVGIDGSIPTDQLVKLGLRPGAHLRVVVVPDAQRDTIAGALPELSEVAWEDFEAASNAAQGDLGVA